MPSLSLTLAPNAREVLPSFLSRLAAANGLDAASFSKDMGFSFKRILNFEETALQALAEVAGLCDKQMDDLVSWTGRPTGDIRIQYRGELIPSRALRSPVIRGCPLCLLADTDAQPTAPLKAMTYRGDWQLAYTKVCAEHGHQLVPLWEEDTPSKRWDFQARFSDLLGAPILTHSKPSNSRVTAYDHWLHQRLRTGKDETWFQAHTIFAASRLCLHIGQQIIRHDIAGPFRTEGEERPEVVGFNALKDEPPRLPAVLNALAAAASGPGDGPKKAFGALHPMLNRDYADADEFAEFCNVFRACILDNWPHAPGDVVLGHVVKERRIHSVASAAKEIGVWEELLDRVLTENGAFSAGDQRPPTRKTFDAIRFRDLLEDIPRWAGPKAICKRLGATKDQFQRLVEHCLLTPTVRDPKVQARWRTRQAQDLLDTLINASVAIPQNAVGWIPLHNAGGQVQGGLKRLIDEIIAGTLPLGYLPDQRGYRSLRVPKSKVIAFSADRPKTAGFECLTAVAYARSIGLRQKGAFLAFVQDGHSPATLVEHPNTNQLTYIMTDEDIDAFEARFTTITMLSAETGLHRNTVRHTLNVAGIHPFTQSGRDYGGIYLREDAVQAVFEKHLNTNN